MRRSSFYNFLILVIIMSSPISLSAQQVDEKTALVGADD